MFASRTNQENAVYAQQTAAAAKPLNQGVKGLAPKTPGAKVSLKNDENKTFGGKNDGKRGLFGDDKTGKVDKTAFVTPAGNKTRAPLGNKTTNAKAANFQTPAPPTQEKGSAKHTSPRLRRAKIKVHEAEPEIVENGAEEREIEYMAPREVPLPDHPDDWPADRTYPQFEGKNLTRGWWSEFSKQLDEDEDTEFSDFEEKLKAAEQNERKEKAREGTTGKKGTPVKKAGLQTAKKDPLTSKAPQTVKARSAASALSKTSKPIMTASIAAPKTRPTSTLTAKKSMAPPPIPGNTRHTVAKVASNQTLGYSKGRAVSGAARDSAAKVASNSTLGYSKGRAVSGVARQPLAQLQGKQVSAPATKARSASPQKKMLGAAALDELFGMPNLDIASDDEDGMGGKGVGSLDEDDELDAFQLEPVEL